jgi:hypothetical protein
MKDSMRHHRRLAVARFAVILPLVAVPVLGAVLPASVASAAPVTGAVSTTTNTDVDGSGHCKNGNEAINCNQYDGKQYVWLSGLPTTAGLNNGTYFFAVTVPGGQGNNITANPNDGTDKNLSDTTAAPWISPASNPAFNADGTKIPTGDSYTNRTFTLANGVISYVGGHEFDAVNNKIRLMPYDDTTNPGGVYIVAVCQIADSAGTSVALDPQYGDPGINPSECKYDAFMVKTGDTAPQAEALTVVKGAAGTYTNTYGWTISKEVDRSYIETSDSSATVNYTVRVQRDTGTASDVKVAGKITVTNPNATVVDGVNVSDTLSNGTTCSVAGGSDVSVPSGPTDFSYTCDLGSSLPSGDLSNVVSIDWAAQDLGTPGFLLAGSAGFQFDNIAFKSSDVNDCVDVSDSIAGVLGNVCGDKSWTYERTIDGTAGTCTTVDNTATIVGTNESASAEVKLCVGADLAVSKTVVPTFNRAYLWNIGKDVDKTLVEQLGGGTATFNYTVKADQTGVTDSGWAATGVITITNPNNWESINVSSLSDLVDNGGVCTIDSSVSLPFTIAKSESKTVAYSCTFTGGSSRTNTATAGWDKAAASTPDDSATGTAGFEFTTPTTRVHQTATVRDTFNGTTSTLGTLTGTDSAPFATGTYAYPRLVNVPTWNCVNYANTAAIFETGQHADQTVRVCGPAKTGALTMGFWQNKNGQGIITTGTSVAGVCKSGTWLRGYAPFQDLSATATCAQVGTYVTNVIKAASAAGTSMNPMLKAQMLATSLDVYFSDAALGGNRISAPAPIGAVSIDLTKICKMIDGSGGGTCAGSFENVSSGFGGAASLTVNQMLTYAANQSNAGGSAWYGQVKATQGLAKDAFDAINNQVAFSAV